MKRTTSPAHLHHCLSLLLLAAAACGSSGGGSGSTDGSGKGTGTDTGKGTGTNTSTSTGAPGGSAGGTPTPGSTWNGSSGVGASPRLPGGGAVSNTPLAPGCAPASANECPTLNGACATGAGKTVEVRQYGTLCLWEERVLTLPATTIEYLEEAVGGQTYYRFRVTFNPGFVDNSYGVNSIGWPPRRGHRWSDLVKSDHTELQLFDKEGRMAMHFKMDYISPDSSRSCGYGTLGITGGDGAMLVGDPAHVLAVTTSLDRSLNACGYCSSPACGGSCTVNSPATDDNYTPNPLTPNWDYRVQYDVWIASAAFAGSAFGHANISYVHASPAKTPEETLTVTPKPCPPPWSTPYPPPTPPTDEPPTPPTPPPGSCPVGWVEYLTSEGAVCVPTPTTPPGGGAPTCPVDWTVFITSEGAVCLPTPSTPPGGGAPTCPVGWVEYLTSEGAVCLPTPTTPPGGGAPTCPVDWTVYLTSEGAVCLPTPSTPPGGGSPTCPVDWTVYLTSEGAICVPQPGETPMGGAPVCPENWTLYLTSEGAFTCTPTPGGSPQTCPVDWTLYLTSEGAACLPQPRNGVCPAGYKPDVASEGARCI